MPVLPNSVLPGATSTPGASFGAQALSGITSSALGSVGLSPAATRQNVATMFNYSNRTAGPQPVLLYPKASTDWRVRISLAPNSTYFYNDPNNSLLSPLITETGTGVNSIAGAIGGIFGSAGTNRVGVVFPYTPQVTVQHIANYSPQRLTHNNYAQYFYDNSEVQAISITGDFTVQNVNEGQYLLATIYFLRSVTKMFFGADKNAGNPPPLVYLNGYGEYYFPNVPCVVTSFQHIMPGEVDYMDIPEPGATNKGYNPQFQNYRLNSTRLPTTSSITLTLQPVYSRVAQGIGFSLNDFAAGALVNAPGSAGAASSFGSSNKATNATKFKPNGGFL